MSLPERCAKRLPDRAREINTLRRMFGLWRGLTASAEDRWRGIKTETVLVPRGVTAGKDVHLYVPLAYGQARKVLRTLRLTRNDVVMDVGCGLGRILVMAACGPARKVIGVECDPMIAEEARSNLARRPAKKSPTTVLTGDAATLDFSEVTVVVLFNPFGPHTMRSMLECLRASVEAHPRSVRIAYINPTAASTLEECGWLTQTAVTRSARFRYSVSYWQSTPPPSHL